MYSIDGQTSKDKDNQNNSIKFETESIKSSICDYSDEFVLVIGDIAATEENNTDLAFRKCARFSTCNTEINNVFIDEASHIYIKRPM